MTTATLPTADSAMFHKRTLTIVLGVALVAGCARGAEESPSSEPVSGENYPESQDWALADGVVSADEYVQAIDKYVSCVRNSGYRVTDPVQSPIDGLTLLFDITPEGDPGLWSATVEDCNVDHLSHIEPAYVEAHDQSMTIELRDVTAECLESNGVAVSKLEQNVVDFVSSAKGNTKLVMSCISTSMKTLYPDMPGFLKVRF
ncbi:hypothetical protein [Micromonospora sp. LOL_021]|uniref:hypothetical protein n=1 Tax=Micromonospora sp. LOL_021 TaxID=3345417 RepID=UPI003A877F4B